MNSASEKVYVGIGNDLQDGLKTLEWTLRKWSSHPISISIVILHVANDISKEFIYTPFGKLPASSVSDEKVEVLRSFEQEKIDKLLSKYINFCGKVKAEICRIEKSDEPVQKKIVDLISELQITNLVMAFTFLKHSSWKSKNAISESFYIHINKPDCCQLYLIWEGKQVFLREESHGRIMEDEEGVMVAKFRDKPSFRNMFGSLFTENFRNFRHSTSFSSFSSSSSSSTIPNSSVSQTPWEITLRELDNYYDQLMALNLEDENLEEEEDDDDGVFVCPNGSDITERAASIMRAEEKMEVLKTKMEEAGESIQLKNNEAKANAERLAKAGWAISLCNRRTEELEARVKEEAANRQVLTKELDSIKDHIQEISCVIEENKGRLNSLIQLQSELSGKLQNFVAKKSVAEAQLENAVTCRTEMVREIEELRLQRDVVNRRIEFCKAKDAVKMMKTAVEMMKTTSEGRCSMREYTGEEIRLATSDFSDRLRLKITGGDDGAAWFRARINHSTVAIKMVDSATDTASTIHFQAKVEFLSQIRHPNLVALLGICFDPKCIIFDYMHNATLSDMLLDATPQISRDKSQPLRWFDRIRILAEVCSGLAFLHEAQPRPVVHGHIGPSNVFLDHNLVAKIGTHNLVVSSNDGSDLTSDIRAFGSLVLKSLKGNKWGSTEVDRLGGGDDLSRALDDVAGQWPLDLAEALVELGLRCVGCVGDTRIGKVMEEVNQIRRMADDLVSASGLRTHSVTNNEDDQCNVPRIFFCPIFQEVMKNPHIAADGFSYELEAIEEWINTRHDTSPMTNLKLDHTHLTPNQTLRSLIQDWHDKMSVPLL